MKKLFILISAVSALQFGYEQQPSTQLCFNDNMSKDDIFDFRLSANSSDYNTKISISTPENKSKYQVLYEGNNSWIHTYQYVVEMESGQIRYCLFNQGNDVIAYNITYKTGNELADMQKVATRADLNQMQMEMENLGKMMDHIKRERGFMLQRYEVMGERQTSISKKQMAFGLFCIGLSFIITVITVHLIKRIIKQKKII